MAYITSMPPTAYNRTISTIRDYPRLVYELDQLKRDAGNLKATNHDGLPKGSKSSGIDAKIAYMVDLEKEVQKMQALFDTIPEEFQEGILNNIIYRVGFPHVPSRSTWYREKNKFVLRFAKEMRIYGKYSK